MGHSHTRWSNHRHDGKVHPERNTMMKNMHGGAHINVCSGIAWNYGRAPSGVVRIRCIRLGSTRLLRWQKTADFRCGAGSRKEKREERLARSGEKQPYAQRRSAREALIARRRRKAFVSCREPRACRRTKGRSAIDPLKKTAAPTASTGGRL